MINYNSLERSAQQDLKKEVNDYAAALGGQNRFFHLLEYIRKENPHPLALKSTTFNFGYGTVKWGKVIFKDKIQLLKEMAKKQDNSSGFLPKKGDRNYKATINFLRTVGPMEFEFRPKNKKDGAGFKLKAFNVVDENTTNLNFIFDVIFFLPINIVKKIYKGPRKSTD